MNLFFMSLIYPSAELTFIKEKCKSGMQMQLDNFQKLIISALKSNHNINDLYICNALPVGVFPKHYSDIYLPSSDYDEVHSIGSFNLPYFKQRTRKRAAQSALLKWVEKSQHNRHVLIYSLYLPFMQAAVNVKETYPDLHISLIVPDIPTELGLASGRTGAMLALEQSMAKKSVKLCQEFDSFVLLTEYMKDVLPIKDSASCCVVEGLAPNAYASPDKSHIDRCYDELLLDRAKPTVVYTGTVQEELGIRELVEAFNSDALQDVNLVIAGSGTMERELESLGMLNVRYLGFIDREKALLLQAGADILINPRSDIGAYTKYSFPSKTMEYMLSAVPVLCYKLSGIPDEYDKYLHYIDRSIADSIVNLLECNRLALREQALDGKYFVLNEKNADAQVQKIIDMWI